MIIHTLSFILFCSKSSFRMDAPHSCGQ